MKNPFQRSLPTDEAPAKPAPSPAALAFVSRLTDEDWSDVYRLAAKIDEVAQQARDNERWRIFHMGFVELFAEYWKGKKLARK